MKLFGVRVDPSTTWVIYGSPFRRIHMTYILNTSQGSGAIVQKVRYLLLVFNLSFIPVTLYGPPNSIRSDLSTEPIVSCEHYVCGLY